MEAIKGNSSNSSLILVSHNKIILQVPQDSKTPLSKHQIHSLLQLQFKIKIKEFNSLTHKRIKKRNSSPTQCSCKETSQIQLSNTICNNSNSTTSIRLKWPISNSKIKCNMVLGSPDNNSLCSRIINMVVNSALPCLNMDSNSSS